MRILAMAAKRASGTARARGTSSLSLWRTPRPRRTLMLCGVGMRARVRGVSSQNRANPNARRAQCARGPVGTCAQAGLSTLCWCSTAHHMASMWFSFVIRLVRVCGARVCVSADCGVVAVGILHFRVVFARRRVVLWTGPGTVVGSCSCLCCGGALAPLAFEAPLIFGGRARDVLDSCVSLDSALS